MNGEKDEVFRQEYCEVMQRLVEPREKLYPMQMNLRGGIPEGIRKLMARGVKFPAGPLHLSDFVLGRLKKEEIVR